MVKKSSSSDNKKEKEGIPSAPPVFDVSKPGETAASPTSKPVIVGHKTIIKNDPMVSGEPEEEKTAGEEKVEIRHKRETKINPINEPPEEKSTSADNNPQETIKKEKTEPENSNESEKKESEGDKPSEQKSTGSGAIDALASEASAKRQSQKEKEEEEKKQKAIEELIKNGKYNLPIHDTVYGGNGAFAWFINLTLAVLLLLAGIVFAQDAGYIDIGLVLPFDLIK